MLKAGDIFVVAPPKGHENFASNAIVGITTKYEVDGVAISSHAGIIIDGNGTTFEAIWPRYSQQNIWDAYRGCRVLIGRHIDMTPDMAQKGYNAVKHLAGMRYPAWRLALFAKAPWVARKWHWKRPTCGEMQFWHLSAAGCRKNLSGDMINYWWGVYPAYCRDFIRDTDVVDVIYDSF